jgi:hypothetical protein
MNAVLFEEWVEMRAKALEGSKSLLNFCGILLQIIIVQIKNTALSRGGRLSMEETYTASDKSISWP